MFFINAWEQRKLGDNSQILTGGTPKTQIKEYWKPKDIPWMSSGEINKKRLTETDNKISRKGFENSSARWVKEKSVLIALAGQGKTRGTVAINEFSLTTNQSIAAIEPNQNIESEFLYQNLGNRYDELRLRSSGDGTRGGLNKQIISELLVVTPTIEEQIKIGNFFKQFDDTIALYQDKLEKLKRLKQGFFQIFFANEEKVPKVRFTGFSGEWEQRKLGEVVQITMGQSPNGKNYTENPIDHILVQGNADMKNGKVVPRVWTTQITKTAKPNDIILSVRAPVGDIGKTDYDVVLGRGVAGIRGNNFVYQSLIKMKETGFWTRYSTGSTFESISSTDLKDAVISIPNEKEQQKIGTFFKKLDNTIVLLQKKLSQLKKLKKAFLQSMFI